MKDEKIRVAFYCEKNLIERADIYTRQANCRSRNEFLAKAMRHYIAFLQKENDNEFLTPALESVIGGMIGSLENRLAQVIYRLAVEVSMMLHVTASGADIPESDLIKLRAMCAEEVSRLNGKVSFEKAYRHQKG
jgi:metal-responsive CopG/Arc/MetJ family transcriptional regulator